MKPSEQRRYQTPIPFFHDAVDELRTQIKTLERDIEYLHQQVNDLKAGKADRRGRRPTKTV
jgi:phage shock protein A